MLDKLERKFGRFAVPRLMTYIIGGYVIGYMLMFGANATGGNYISLMTLEPYMIIHNLEIWRIISWVMIPPSRGIFWAIIMCIFYWQLGSYLERMWGTFKFNVYIFGGLFFTIVGAFALYGVMYAINGIEPVNMGAYFSTYYINMSIFLAFALAIPDMPVMLYFCIPVKMKWLAYLYAAFIAYDFIFATWAGRVAIICSLLNFFIFFFSSRNMWGKNARRSRTRTQYGPFGGFNKQQTYTRTTTEPPKRQYSATNNSPVARHKCAICGRTELTNPELDFRFCSKCNGNYEYCSDHLFTHTHVE